MMADIRALAEGITREVCFTDYHCAEAARMEVCISLLNDQPVANISMASGETTMLLGTPLDYIREPDLLRSYAHTLLAAADEMDGMGSSSSAGEAPSSAALDDLAERAHTDFRVAYDFGGATITVRTTIGGHLMPGKPIDSVPRIDLLRICAKKLAQLEKAMEGAAA